MCYFPLLVLKRISHYVFFGSGVLTKWKKTREAPKKPGQCMMSPNVPADFSRFRNRTLVTGVWTRAVNGQISWTPKGPQFFFCLCTPFFWVKGRNKNWGPLGVQVGFFLAHPLRRGFGQAPCVVPFGRVFLGDFLCKKSGFALGFPCSTNVCRV